METIQTPKDVLEFLKNLPAPAVLIHHAVTVMKTAEQILNCLNLPVGAVKPSIVLMGAALHDVGKIQHPSELHEPGHEHEAAGYHLLISYGFPDVIAEMCRAHSQWQKAQSLETLIVALADKLW